MLSGIGWDEFVAWNRISGFLRSLTMRSTSELLLRMAVLRIKLYIIDGGPWVGEQSTQQPLKSGKNFQNSNFR